MGIYLPANIPGWYELILLIPCIMFCPSALTYKNHMSLRMRMENNLFIQQPESLRYLFLNLPGAQIQKMTFKPYFAKATVAFCWWFVLTPPPCLWISCFIIFLLYKHWAYSHHNRQHWVNRTDCVSAAVGHKFPIQFKSSLPRRTHGAQIRWHSHLCSLVW